MSGMLAIEHELVTPLVLPDDLIDFLGERYSRLPAPTRVRITFERYLIYRVRNGALFEKITCPRVNRRNAARNFQPRGVWR